MTDVQISNGTQLEVFVPHNSVEKANYKALCSYFSEMCYW